LQVVGYFYNDQTRSLYGNRCKKINSHRKIKSYVERRWIHRSKRYF